MALMKCPDCGAEYSKKAEVCPQCGRPNKKKKGCATGCLTLLVVFLGLSAFICIAQQFVPEPTPEEKEVQRLKQQKEVDSWHRSSAFVARKCGRYLKEDLKAPSSYKFGKLLSGIPNGSNGVDVRFTFTAVNSFNAPLQYGGTCSTSKDADGQWNLNYGIER